MGPYGVDSCVFVTSAGIWAPATTATMNIVCTLMFIHEINCQTFSNHNNDDIVYKYLEKSDNARGKLCDWSSKVWRCDSINIMSYKKVTIVTRLQRSSVSECSKYLQYTHVYVLYLAPICDICVDYERVKIKKHIFYNLRTEYSSGWHRRSSGFETLRVDWFTIGILYC